MSYKVRFVDYPKQYSDMKEELDGAFQDVMSNGDFIMRHHLDEFEATIAEYCGVKHAIGVNTGTDALYLCASAIGLKPGDEVITVAHTFVATVGAVTTRGATPILVDVSDDFNIDVEQIEKCITLKTKAIFPVHLNGHMCNMDRIMEIAEKNHLFVIEDAAQALGAKYKGKRSTSFGLAGIFSFYPAKMLGTAGDGGMVCTNDDSFARQIRALRDNGRVDSVEKIECYGYCSRLDNLHAALLNVKFKYFPEWVARRREIAGLYNEGLTGISDLSIHPVAGDDYFDVYQNYVIRTTRRDELYNHLKDSGIEVLISWSIPMHKQIGLGLSHFKLPKTERLSSEVISLPMYPELSDESVGIVVGVIRKFF